jgi:tetratricopeptide (TPR) repeat protein
VAARWWIVIASAAMRLRRTPLHSSPRTRLYTTSTALLLALALGSLAPAVRAADPRPSSSAAQADQLFRDARVLLEQGRYREACRMFERSLELEPSPGTLLNLGNCYEQDADLARALSTFERAVADSQLEKNETKRKAWVQAGSQRVDSLLARVPVLNLTPSPTPGASVRLDGEELTKTRGPLRLNAGHHIIEVSAPGKRMQRNEIELRVAERLDLSLPALEDSAAVAPLPSREPPIAEPPPSAHRPSAVPWVLVGSGALLTTAGVVTGLMANSRESSLEKGCGVDGYCANPALRSTRDSGEKLEIATYILWAAGGAGMVVGFTLLALDHDQEEPPSQLSLGCFDGGCGLHAAGTF